MTSARMKPRSMSEWILPAAWGALVPFLMVQARHSFLTYGKDECRAWTIRKGTKAPQAAGKIHSDIERGFIRAETINFDEMMACGGSVAAAKEKGLLRSEGKDYVVKDGDMIYFRFNV